MGLTFENCVNLTDVYYAGSKQQWQTIGIGVDNAPLTSTAIHYNVVPGTYIVSYDPNGGTGAPEEQAKQPGNGLTLSYLIPAHESESAGGFTVRLNFNGGSQAVTILYAPRTASYKRRSVYQAA